MSITPMSTTSHSSNPSASTYLSYPVSHVLKGVYRRLTEPSPSEPSFQSSSTNSRTSVPPPQDTHEGIYTPPYRTASPFQPPPLTPLTLVGGGPADSDKILSKVLAEEIRLLLPPRLQLAEQWALVYGLEEDGVSLATLYTKCAQPSIPKSSSFVLVIRDGAGGVGFFSLRSI